MKKLLTASALALALAAPFALSAADGAKSEQKTGRMERALEKLPKEKAAAFKEALKASREASEPKREAMRKLRDELDAIVAAPTFDKAAFLAKHKEINAVKTELAQAREEAMANALSKLTQAERKAVQEGFKKRYKLKEAKPEADKSE